MSVIVAPTTLHLMAVKEALIPRELVDRVSLILREIVDRDFGGNGTRAARQLGISQAQVSGLYSGNPGKGVGLGTILALRRYTKRSLDDLCGFSTEPTPDFIATLQRSLDEVKKHLAAPPKEERQKADYHREMREARTKVPTKRKRGAA